MRWLDEFRRAGEVRFEFQLTRIGLRTSRKHLLVSRPQHLDEILTDRWHHRTRFDPVGKIEYAQNVVEVFRPLRHNLVVQNDVSCFFEREPGAFDVVGEIRLQEGEVNTSAALGGNVFHIGQHRHPKRRRKRVEQREARGIDMTVHRGVARREQDFIGLPLLRFQSGLLGTNVAF